MWIREASLWVSLLIIIIFKLNCNLKIIYFLLYYINSTKNYIKYDLFVLQFLILIKHDHFPLFKKYATVNPIKLKRTIPYVYLAAR